MARTILTAGTPAVIALQEVENQRVLEDLAAHDLLEEYAYQAFLKEEAGGEGLAVGYLIRTEEGEVLSLDRHTAPEGFPNPSLLLLEVAITRGEQEQTLFVINTHFTASQVGAANNPVQQALADWVVKLVEGIQDEQPGAQVVVAGSLNAGLGSTPVEMLKQAGLAHVFEVLPEEERYTAIEEGISWALDHMLVSPDMNERLSRVHVLHVNADFPVPLAGDVSPRRASDHDPVIAFFTFPD
jgi:predicted extracellular nuclease